MNLDSLKNTGVVCLNEVDEVPEGRTLVVVGVARGGTSIVSGALHFLEVFMGDYIAAPVFEDVRLSRAFEGDSKEDFEAVIEEYNRRHSVWGWKRPSSLEDLPRVSAALRNPYFIFVFRDPLLIANRNAISMGTDLLEGLDEAVRGLRKIVDFIWKSKAPAMLVSSEKAVGNKDQLLAEVCRFAGISPSESQMRAALDFVSPDPDEYLDATRITKCRGEIELEGLGAGMLRGWAKAVHHERPVSVEVLVDNELAGTVLADLPGGGGVRPRNGVEQRCRFEVNLVTLGAKPGSEIRARVQGDIRDLENSPAVYSDAGGGSDSPSEG